MEAFVFHWWLVLFLIVAAGAVAWHFLVIRWEPKLPREQPGETREEFFRRMIREVIERRIADPNFIKHTIQRHRFAGRPLPPDFRTMLLELEDYVAAMERGETPQGPSWLVPSHQAGGDLSGS